MSPTWDSSEPRPDQRLSPLGWLVAVPRFIILVLLVVPMFAVLMLLRLIEAPLFGLKRPWTPAITRLFCRTALRVMGLRLVRTGRPMRQPGAMVANHSSWLDIFVLNASDHVYFVSKSEVAQWPGIGVLARGAGTVFIERHRSKARAQAEVFRHRLSAGHRLVFFPEGTSTDNQRVLGFKSTLFAAFMDEPMRAQMYIQPISVVYAAPRGRDPRFYGWWGDMDFGAHFLLVLSPLAAGQVTVIYHEPLALKDFENRKALAAAAEAVVRAGHDRHLGDG